MQSKQRCYVSQPHKGSVYEATRDPRFRFSLLWKACPVSADTGTSIRSLIYTLEWFRVPDSIRRSANTFFGIG
jgi:hypothetical protein